MDKLKSSNKTQISGKIKYINNHNLDMAKAKQHYVPQSILRNFKCEAKVAQPKIFCLSKKSCKIFSPDISDVAAEKDYYNKKGSSKLPSDDYDSIFNKLDSGIAPILQKIRVNRLNDAIVT